MKINNNKTKHVTFTRKVQYFVSKYYMNGNIIEKVDKIHDLGIQFYCNFLFN